MTKYITFRAAFDNYSHLIRREFLEEDLPTKFKIRDEIEAMEKKIMEMINGQ